MKISEMTELDPVERSRTYVFSRCYDGLQFDDKTTFYDVTHLYVSDSGTHRLLTADGKLHIVPSEWKYITIEADDWTV